jgi:hypothetical protein
MKKVLIAVATTFLSAASAQAALVQIELWDVLAGPSTCCATNPTAAVQDAARTVDTGNTVLANLADPFNAFYLPLVNNVIVGEGAHFTFSMDSSLLTAGFYVNGITGLAGGGQTLNNFFGFDIDGAGNGIGNNSVLGTILRITGFVDVVANDPYQIRSDDGYSVAIGAAPVVVNDGLQAPTTTNHAYVGPAGIKAFSMVWFDNQRSEAALKVTGLNFVTAVPLPAGLPLLLAGFGALLALRSRKKAA